MRGLAASASPVAALRRRTFFLTTQFRSALAFRRHFPTKSSFDRNAEEFADASTY
jgi:hypothetical protein